MNQDFSVERLADDLDTLADDYPAYLKTQPAPNIKALLIQLKPQLERLRAGGASYQQIHQILLDKGVKVSIYTVRLYLADIFRAAPVVSALHSRVAPAVSASKTPSAPAPAPAVSAPIRRAAPEIPIPSKMPSGTGWRSPSAQIDGDLI